MDTESTAAVEKLDERLKASEGEATNSEELDLSFENTLQSSVEGLAMMTDRTEQPEEAVEANHSEEVIQLGEAAADNTTEETSLTADVIKTSSVFLDGKHEEATENGDLISNISATENADRIAKESRKPDEETGSSASSQEILDGSLNKPKESKDEEGNADANLEASTEQADEIKAGPAAPIVSSSKKSRPSFTYDPNKITLRFLFANRDGLAVTIECNPSDTVGEVKGALISAWPEDAPPCATGDNLRLVCMGKGFLMPDARTLEDMQIPTFKTHPTPINVSIKPTVDSQGETKDKKLASGIATPNSGRNAENASNAPQASGGCPCSIL